MCPGWAGVKVSWRRQPGAGGVMEGRTDGQKTAAFDTQPWEQGREAGQSTNVALETQRQGEMCLPNSSPAAGTTAERIPARKQWWRQKKELRKKTLGKHEGQHRGEGRRPRRQMEGTKVQGGKKKKRQQELGNNGTSVVKEGRL